jgi:hypothetical protein
VTVILSWTKLKWQAEILTRQYASVFSWLRQEVLTQFITQLCHEGEVEDSKDDSRPQVDVLQAPTISEVEVTEESVTICTVLTFLGILCQT